MRDGTILFADVYRLEGTNTFPILLQRLPYNKENYSIGAFMLDPISAAQAGYAVILQDTRGRFNSEGEFYPFEQEALDGYDSVEWAAMQPWSNGKVGLYGDSYVGATTLLAATKKPPHLYAIAPMNTAADYYEGWAYRGGAFELAFNLFWTVLVLSEDYLTKLFKRGILSKDEYWELIELRKNYNDLLKVRPLKNILPPKDILPWFRKWIEHPIYDEYWKSLSLKPHYNQIEVPVFHIGGWYDIFLNGTIDNFQGINKCLISKQKSRNQLLIGPWSHASQLGVYSEIDFGIYASKDAIGLQNKLIEFFDYWLKGQSKVIDLEYPIEIFVMGKNRWEKFKQWPISHTYWEKYYFHSDGNANTLNGDGKLCKERPVLEKHDEFIFDPINPVPTIGGQTCLPGLYISANAGPRDQRIVENRDDVLCYTSETLTNDIEVIGPIKAKIYASSTAKDTDWILKLVDVYPDGKAFNVTEGILRARYREGFEKTELLIPNEVYEFEIDMNSTAYLFKQGHKIRLEITSSNFPRFDINSNTGGNIAEEDYDEMIKATNKIYHNNIYPSHITLPIIK